MKPKLWYADLFYLPEVAGHIVGDQNGGYSLFPRKKYEDHEDMMDPGRVVRLPESAYFVQQIVHLYDDPFVGGFPLEGGIVRVAGRQMLLKWHGWVWRFRAGFDDWTGDEKWYTWGKHAECVLALPSC